MCEPFPTNLQELENPDSFIEVGLNDLRENNTYIFYHPSYDEATTYGRTCIRVVQVFPDGFMMANDRNNSGVVFRPREVFEKNVRFFRRVTEQDLRDRQFNSRAPYLAMVEGTDTNHEPSFNYLRQDHTMHEISSYIPTFKKGGAKQGRKSRSKSTFKKGGAKHGRKSRAKHERKSRAKHERKSRAKHRKKSRAKSTFKKR